ncbi:MAG: hypothetical protein EBW14_14165, partial [Oxalobacteraceae bacterium]|nr:hypothetical protein [Oxalobacteraceae bacterium]
MFDDILRNTTHGVTPWRLRAGLIKIRIVIKPGNPTLWQGLSVRSSLNYYTKSYFSIAHRGAPLFFPEHTVESLAAANLMGAGIFECDVTFTKDKQLVCRHAQNDLHSTTNILKTGLSKKCTRPFVPSNENSDAVADCRTTDLTLEEFQSLKG